MTFGVGQPRFRKSCASTKFDDSTLCTDETGIGRNRLVIGDLQFKGGAALSGPKPGMDGADRTVQMPSWLALENGAAFHDLR